MASSFFKDNMKRLTTLISICLAGCISVFAQPRALGTRVGAMGFELSYQHDMGKKSFIQTDLGLDFGYSSSSTPGIKATVLYNFIIARPAWTDRGSWSLHAGPGISLGSVFDRIHYGNVGEFHPIQSGDYGFMLALAVQAGLEYTFWFPLQIAVDIRPYFGMHANGKIIGIKTDSNSMVTMRYLKGKTGYYDHGWLGFIPALSVRYRF